MVVDGENNRSYETEGKDTEVYISRVVCENNRSYETEGKDTEGYIYGELFMRTIGVMKQKVKIMRDIYIYMERCLWADTKWKWGMAPHPIKKKNIFLLLDDEQFKAKKILS